MTARLFTTFTLAAALAASVAAPALAQGSIGGGIYTQSGNGSSSTGGALIYSTSNAVPLVPLSVGLTGFVPVAQGGGYAVTVDGKFAIGRDAIGVGYGIGQFGAGHSGGTATIFFDHRLNSMLSFELRGYRTTSAQGATAGFAGLTFTL